MTSLATFPDPDESSASSSMPLSRSSKKGRAARRLRHAAISYAVLCNCIRPCGALSVVGRRPPYHTGHGQTFATPSSWARTDTRGNEHGVATELSLYRRRRHQNYWSTEYEYRERTSSSLEETNIPMRGRRESIMKRRRQIGTFVQTLRSKLWRRKGQALDDTLHADRADYALDRGNGGGMGTNYSPTSRLARVQSFANSPLASSRTSRLLSSSSSSTSTALGMVLSTPDTIIEQASTQGLLDTLLDESVRTQSRQPIMIQFNPKRGWLWRQWRGTVFSETWKSGLLNMALATFVVFLYGLYPGLKDTLQGFSILWGQLLSVTTFTLTFFLNQSYGLWRKCHDYSRRLQGRLNDLGMTLAAHATRDKPSSPNVPSTYTPQSRQALQLVSRYVRVFNLLTYASFTRSHRPILTPLGMRRLVERGILTPREREILADAEIPATQRHNAVLVWLIRLFLEGRQAGVFEGGTGFEQQFMEKCHVIRAQYGAIGDELQGRMPLAYAHIVQVLLDVVLWMYPFMALSTGMAWYIGILGTGLLTMFYQGLFDLAKQFLDPYDNENYGKGDDPLVIDTLIAETNAGSVRWMNSFQQQPWDRQLLNDGELYDSMLPLQGYSIEDLAEMEAQEEKERQERQAAIKEKKRREEEKARQRSEELLKKHLESAANGTETISVVKNGTAVLSPADEALIDSTDGGMISEKKFMAVSRGEVVATSSLLPSGSPVGEAEEALSEDDANNATEAVEMENKVLTLADGTLVTLDDSLTMNTTGSSVEAPESLGDVEGVKVENITSTAMDALPQILDEANEVPWDQLGVTPNFEESIAEMEAFEAESPYSLKNVESPKVSLYDVNNGISDARGGDKYLEDDDLEDDDIFEPMTIEWFDEVGPDGQEYRLSQMLADEEWLEEEETGTDLVSDLIPNIVPQNKTMTYEEFTRKASDLMAQAENELAETKEILSVAPGRDAGLEVSSNRDGRLIPAALPARRKVMEEPSEPMYDQTMLDPISQLWGAPPDVLEKSMNEDDDEADDYMINEGINFKGVYSLWGEGAEAGLASSEEEEGPTSYTSVEGFSQLWNEDLAPYKAGMLNDNFRDSSVDPLLNINDLKAFAGVEWWDEVSDDGSFKSLSQMLADEEYEETLEEEEEAPMTFERFAEETEKLIEQAEDERKETEAIMNAPPNAAFLEGGDGELAASSAVEKSVVTSEKFKEMIKSLSESEGENGEEGEDDEEEETISDEEINVLEMDDFPGEDKEGSTLPVDADDDDGGDGNAEVDSIPHSVLESENDVGAINEDEN